jgi:hypothetical protein
MYISPPAIVGDGLDKRSVSIFINERIYIYIYHLQQSLGIVLIGGSPCFSLRRWQNLIKNTGDCLGVMYSTVVPEGRDRRSIADTCV